MQNESVTVPRSLVLSMILSMQLHVWQCTQVNWYPNLALSCPSDNASGIAGCSCINCPAYVQRDLVGFLYNVQTHTTILQWVSLSHTQAALIMWALKLRNDARTNPGV